MQEELFHRAVPGEPTVADLTPRRAVHGSPPEVQTTGAAHPVSFQILSLDGGGVRGLFSAAVLAHLEEDLQVRIADHFDLITGTSTGGLIALGLAFGLRPKEIVDFYLNRSDVIFHRSWPRLPLAQVWRQLWRTKYDNAPLIAALKDVFGDHCLGECHRPVVIPTFNLSTDGVRLFKTPHHDRLTRDWRTPIWQVALATSAAPTYLPASTVTDHQRLIDGGMWANNPILVGIAEALSMLGAPLRGLQVLSLGTARQVGERGTNLDRGGLWQWRKDAVEVMMRAQNCGAHGLAQHLIGHERVHRLDPVVKHGTLSLDRLDPSRLQSHAAEVSQTFSPVFSARFRPHRAGTYVPLLPQEVVA